ANHVWKQPRDAIEAPVDGRGQYRLTAKILHEGVDDLIVVLALGEVRRELLFLRLVPGAVQHAARADRKPASARADDFVFDLSVERALLVDWDRLLRERRRGPQQRREKQHGSRRGAG